MFSIIINLQLIFISEILRITFSSVSTIERNSPQFTKYKVSQFLNKNSNYQHFFISLYIIIL